MIPYLNQVANIPGKYQVEAVEGLLLVIFPFVILPYVGIIINHYI